MTPSERRFDDLYLRYWDDRLSEAEAAEFAALLRDDPLARDWFRMNNLQAVAVADLPVAEPRPVPVRHGWSRRRVLQFLGGGVAAGLTAGILGRYFFPAESDSVAHLTESKGGVSVTTSNGRPLPPIGPLPPDAVVETHGTHSTATLVFANGSDVMLAGDSTLAFTRDTRQPRLMRGTAVAEVRPVKFNERPLMFHTAEAVCSAVGAALLTLTHAGRVTEVGVHTGQVAVTEPTGEPIDSVHDGELFTLRADGQRSKQPLFQSEEDYTLDLTQPLPEGWFVGRKFDEPSGPVIRPELWYDPYHQTEMYQIRSHNRWSRGLVNVQPDSVVTVRYRVRTLGRGQVCLVCRTEDLKEAATGVLEWNSRYEPVADNGWNSLTVRAADMLDCKEAPKFGAPWVAFLLIFNTYGSDLGLEVAEFRVSRPGGPGAG
jgi:ferric-dicitrate binding protein FerR (iron transport regulator)